MGGTGEANRGGRMGRVRTRRAQTRRLCFRNALSLEISESSPMSAPIFDPGFPAAQGLYDPRNEHDACGVGFIADMKNRKSHDDRREGPRDPAQPRPSRRGRRRSQGRRRLRHAGADPARVLRRGGGEARLRRCRRPAIMASACCFPAARRARRARIVEEIIERVDRRRGPDAARLARRAGRQLAGSARASSRSSRCIARSSSAAAPASPTRTTFERRLYILRKVISNTRLRRSATRARPSFYPVSLSCRTSSTRACCSPPSSAPITRTCATRASRRRSRSCISASRPTRSRPGSWRIPTAWSPTTARSTRCAATSTGWRRGRPRVDSELFGDDISQAVADLLRRPVGHGLLRQRARIPRAGRLFARPRDDDADPGSLGRQSADG